MGSSNLSLFMKGPHCEEGKKEMEMRLVYVNSEHARDAGRGCATEAGLKGEEREARCKQILISLTPLS